jgi:hypothetical protein
MWSNYSSGEPQVDVDNMPTSFTVSTKLQAGGSLAVQQGPPTGTSNKDLQPNGTCQVGGFKEFFYLLIGSDEPLRMSPWYEACCRS